jgi:hypothetical protein
MANPLYGVNGSSANSPQSVADAALLSGLADSTSFVRDFWPTLLDRYPDRQLIENGLMAHLVDNKAFVGVQTNTTQVFHAEQDSVLATLTVQSAPTSLGGNAYRIVVDATQYNGTTGPTGFFNYATVGQNFQLANNPGVIANVFAVVFPSTTGAATHTIDVYSNGTVNLATAIAAGDTLLPQDAVNDVNGDFPNGSVRGWARYGVNFQYMSTGSAIVGQDTYNQAFMFQLEGGQSILAPRIFADALMTAMLRKSAAITVGKGDSYGPSGSAKQTTVGFVSAAQAFGLTDDYAAGGVQMSDLEDIGIRLQNRGAGTELDLWGGYNFLQSIQRNALSPLTGGAVQYISGEMNDGSGRPGLKKSLGHFILGKFKVNLNEASEWAHKAMYSPDLGGTSLTSGYWANAFCIIPKEQVAVPRELTNTTYTVTAPMFRVLQLKAPVTTGGTPVMNQIVKRDPAHFGAMKYQIINNEYFAAQTMLANKLYFGGTII